jgi:N-methylhydantoinase A
VTPSTSPGFRVAIDTGGTFTDIAVRRPDGSLAIGKVPSTPSAPDDAVVEGLLASLADAGAAPEQVDRFVHGTTVATNTVLTRTGARIGLVATRGFRDVLAIGYQARPSLYDQSVRRPPPLVDAEHTWEVAGRLDFEGGEIEPLDPEELDRLAVTIAAADLEVVVVSLLNAYVDPRHELEVVRVLRARGVAPSVFGATAISPEMREFDRTSTGAINAYVQPRIAGYVDRLSRRSRDAGVAAPLWIMQSNGGLLAPATAAEESARTVLSGLAGGVVGAAAWARALGLDDVVSFDIGGTSTDIALIRRGRPVETVDTVIDGLPLRFPAVEVHTIGAGGGSIAWLDGGGGLRVGPRSAGADPGPVCYGRGGTELTVTDAHLVLGRLGPELLGGRMRLDADLARERMALLADGLGLSLEATAEGIVRVIGATMARGVRKVSVERGIDVRECHLLAFGGAGPLHAGDLLRDLGMRSAVVPPHPGIASAVGMLGAPVRHDLAVGVAATAADPASLDRILAGLEERAAGLAPGVPRRRLVDVHYRGQSYEITVPYHDDPARLRADFDAAHRERYGFDDPVATIEVVVARVIAATDEDPLVDDPAMSAPAGAGSTRLVHLSGAWRETPVLDRAALRAGDAVEGPVILTQFDSTVVVDVGHTCRADDLGFLHITRTEA